MRSTIYVILVILGNSELGARASKNKYMDTMFATKGGSPDPCYNEDGDPKRCIPDFVNAAFGRRVIASSTCGAEPENYCKSSTDKNKEIIRYVICPSQASTCSHRVCLFKPVHAPIEFVQTFRCCHRVRLFKPVCAPIEFVQTSTSCHRVCLFEPVCAVIELVYSSLYVLSELVC